MIEIRFYTVEDIQKITGLKKSKCYEIIKTLNMELESQKIKIIIGKVPKEYFKKSYGLKWGRQWKMPTAQGQYIRKI